MEKDKLETKGKHEYIDYADITSLCFEITEEQIDDLRNGSKLYGRINDDYDFTIILKREGKK